MKTTTQKIQYQTCTGRWVDCEDRTEEFIDRCAEINNLSRDEVVAALESGKILRNDRGDWYSKCRAKPEQTHTQMVTVMCDCGHRVHPDAVMRASLGTSCADCYDKMSN